MLKKVYCDACRKSVEEYLKARDELHTRLATHWSETVVKLKEGWRKFHPRGKLPDER